MDSLKKLATHVLYCFVLITCHHLHICCLRIVQVICVIVVIFSSCLNTLLTCIRNLLSFGHYINMFNKIARPAMFLFVCVF